MGFAGLIRSGELQLHNRSHLPTSHASAYYNHEPLRTPPSCWPTAARSNKLRIALDHEGAQPDPAQPPPSGNRGSRLTIGLAKGRQSCKRKRQGRAPQGLPTGKCVSHGQALASGSGHPLKPYSRGRGRLGPGCLH